MAKERCLARNLFLLEANDFSLGRRMKTGFSRCFVCLFVYLFGGGGGTEGECGIRHVYSLSVGKRPAHLVVYKFHN